MRQSALLMALVVLLALSLSAKKEPPPKNQFSKGAFGFFISSDQKEYTLDDPIYVDVRFFNNTDHFITVFGDLRLNQNTIFHIRDAGSKDLPYQGPEADYPFCADEPEKPDCFMKVLARHEYFGELYNLNVTDKKSQDYRPYLLEKGRYSIQVEFKKDAHYPCWLGTASTAPPCGPIISNKIEILIK